MNETEQTQFWKGTFGDEYIFRNFDNFDKLFKKQFGIHRSDLNNEFLSEIDKNASILEVGCNIGNQLKILETIGFNNLWGIEINRKALSIAKESKNLNVVEGSAFDIPYKDNFFEIVFTNGVLIHIAPDDISKVIEEMYRVTKRYIWCFEYFSKNCEEIVYRGNTNKLWKNDFVKLFLERHPDLKIIKQKKLKYLENGNEDIMFLLEKN